MYYVTLTLAVILLPPFPYQNKRLDGQCGSLKGPLSGWELPVILVESTKY